MTENTDLTNDLTSDPVATDFADVFDDWIGGATIAQRSVEIYGNPALYSEYEKLERELAVEKQVEDAEPSIGETTVSEIETRMAELAEQWSASKSTWTVRGLTSDETDKALEPLSEAPSEPDEPEKPVLPPNPTDNARKVHTIAMQAYEAARPGYDAAYEKFSKEISAYRKEMNLLLVSAAVLKVEYPGGRVVEAQMTEDYEMVSPAVTVDQLRRLRKRLGDRQMLRLLQASQRAGLEEPELTAPFSRSTSPDDPTLSPS